ncbi:MAG: histidine phosphatase family protein [Gammaproteobacteria bacterium]|nr:histidine phosphatase family protein [Gammaproteobacteria bacterium]NVK87587.1 histidine phosphatase family protein [Gammaproteobacteria bacterium]
MITTIYLARHGETQWNTCKRLQGQLDSQLTVNGIAQATQLAQELKTKPISKIFTSPLGRAQHSAAICREILDCEVVTVDDLQERHFGVWQGRSFESLRPQPNFSAIFEQVTDHAPPQGESAVAAKTRLTRTLQQIAQQHLQQSLLVISHGDVIRSFVSDLSAQSFCDAYSQFGNGSSLTVIYDSSQQRFILDI